MLRPLLCAILSACLFAQSPMRNEDVVRMVAEKSPAPEILDAIAVNGAGFNLTPAGMQWMQRNGVSDELIRAMAASQNGRPVRASPTSTSLVPVARPIASEPVKTTQPETDVLRVTTTPPGATVEWNRKVIGVTPLKHKVGEYAFNARKFTLFSKRLSQPVMLRIMMPGFVTKEATISKPMTWASLDGRNQFTFHVIPFQDFDFRLDKVGDPPKVMSNSDVVQLWSAGFGEALIVDKINTSATSFALELGDMVKLRDSGVPDGVIQAMMKKSTPASQ